MNISYIYISFTYLVPRILGNFHSYGLVLRECYCWWFRNPAANQLRLVVYPIIYRVSAPSQVVFSPDFEKPSTVTFFFLWISLKNPIFESLKICDIPKVPSHFRIGTRKRYGLVFVRMGPAYPLLGDPMSLGVPGTSDVRPWTTTRSPTSMVSRWRRGVVAWMDPTVRNVVKRFGKCGNI